MGTILDDIFGPGKEASEATETSKSWVYISGPNAFIEAGEEACRARHSRGVDCYGARWDI